MSVSNVSNQTTTYSAYSSTAKKSEAPAAEKTTATTSANAAGAVYEPSANAGNSDAVKQKQNAARAQQLKEINDARVQQLQQLVQDMISKQGKTLGQADDMWKFLASGDFTVDAATKAQAQADIAEDGYWGVKQTSDRIFDFAMALSGGDEEKMKKMQDAFEKGFKQATSTWGKELPQISQDTYAAVNKKFEDYYANLKAQA